MCEVVWEMCKGWDVLLDAYLQVWRGGWWKRRGEGVSRGWPANVCGRGLPGGCCT